MGLFGKKKEKAETCCGACTPESMAAAEAAKATGGIKVLGSGCAKCNALEAAVRSALEELGMDTAIDHVTDFGQIAAYGVMSTPALVVDGRVVSYGKVLSVEEAKGLIRNARG
ncbi:MAG: TM0996/MTH895 family glutaredoxin-like protein [Oscillospiraceae bacterium]|nr:TM0996/MTH895 family glutaredoxin-like protein [Oscillospiraceae bacterium]